MAATTLEIEIIWENGGSFEMKAKEDAAAWKTVVKADENGQIAALWEHLQDACETFFKAEMVVIGRAMKQ